MMIGDSDGEHTEATVQQEAGIGALGGVSIEVDEITRVLGGQPGLVANVIGQNPGRSACNHRKPGLLREPHQSLREVFRTA